MITRSEIRHALYRKKNGGVTNQSIIDLVDSKIPKGESYDTFSTKWDVLLSKSGEITVIKPETDYDYIHSICLEIALYKRKGMDPEFDDRAINVMQIVELNMLENMNWEDYNKTWGIFIDHDLKRVHTKHFKTLQNVVTNEMIKASRPSDGTEMKEVPSIPAFVVDMEPSELSDTEKALMSKLTKRINK